MRKMRFLAGLLALLLLALPLIACGEEPPVTAPGQGDSQPTPPPPAGSGDNGGGGDDEQDAPNRDPDYDPSKDYGLFLSENGYPMGFIVSFSIDGYGFDTASNSLPNGSATVSYTFTKADLADLYNHLNESNFWSIPLDLTYSKMAGSSAPEGPGIQYTVTVTTAEHGTRTCRTDQAAITRLTGEPAISNVGALVEHLSDCLEMYQERSAA